MTASASSNMASLVDDVRQWPPVTDEASLSASLAFAYGNRLEKRNRSRTHAVNICSYLVGTVASFTFAS